MSCCIRPGFVLQECLAIPGPLISPSYLNEILAGYSNLLGKLRAEEEEGVKG